MPQDRDPEPSAEVSAESPDALWLRGARELEERVNRMGLAAPGVSLWVRLEASSDGVHHHRIGG